MRFLVTSILAAAATVSACGISQSSPSAAKDSKPNPAQQQNQQQQQQNQQRGGGSMVYIDTTNDVHFENKCKMDDVSGIDMTTLTFSVEKNNLLVEMKVDGSILDLPGYREYYLWIDTNQGLKNSGFVPYDTTRLASDNFVYNADKHAWRDFFADYRVFFSVDNNGSQQQRKLFQTCSQDNCASDDSLFTSHTWFEIEKGEQLVRFHVPLDRIGISSSSIGRAIRVGATTFANRDGCSAEDDASNWGEQAIPFSL